MPILSIQEDEPETVRSMVNSTSTFDDRTAIKIIARWRHERLKYPGWLIPTDEMISSLRRETEQYISRLIDLASSWSHVDQVLLFREIVWRIETSMLPLDVSLIEPLETAFDGLFHSLLEGSSLRPSDTQTELFNVSDTDVSKSWLEITFALLRHARESFDATRWDLLKESVSQVIHLYPEYNDRYHYEQALWHLWNLERIEARNLLIQWVPSPHSPLALMWKAGLLIELEEFGESRSLLRSALQEIRQSFQRTQEENIDLLSLEGWCIYLLRPVESEILYRNLFQDSQSQESYAKIAELHRQFLKRWDQLKALDSDPWAFVKYFDRVLSGEPAVTQKVEQVVPGFDLGHFSVRRSLFKGPNTKWLPAFTFLRMLEKVGIPPRFLTDTVRNAARWLAPISFFWSIMLVVRAGNTRAVQESDIANRAQIDSMNRDLVLKLNIWAVNALSSELSSLGSPIQLRTGQESRLEILIEFLSRLTIKLERDELQDAFRFALNLHNLPGIKNHISLNKSCGPWFRRLFNSADSQQLLEWLPELIGFTLSNDANANESPQHPAIPWPDPMTELPFDPVRELHEVDPDLRAKIQEATEWLLYNTQATSGETRQRALMRLFYVFHTRIMTDEQEKRFGDLLWEHSIENGLPDLPGLTSLNYLHLPAPPEIDPRARVKQHLLAMKPYKSVSLDGHSFSVNLLDDVEDRMIREVSSASRPVVRLPSDPQGEITWELTEVSQLWNDVYEWWENDKHVIKRTNQDSSFSSGFDRFARLSLERTSMFLARVVLPQMGAANDDEWSTILSFLSETRQDNVFLSQALPYILLHRPDEHNMVLERILDDLSNGDEGAVSAAAEAVSHWAYLGDESDVERVSPDAINDLIKRVVFRRPEGAKTCLRQLSILISNKPNLIDSDQVNLVVSSLTPWLEATRIPIPEDDRGGFPEHERPLLRALLGHLSSALSDWIRTNRPDQPEPPEVSTLRELYSSDPLPEV